MSSRSSVGSKSRQTFLVGGRESCTGCVGNGDGGGDGSMNGFLKIRLTQLENLFDQAATFTERYGIMVDCKCR